MSKASRPRTRKLCAVCQTRPVGYGTNGDQAQAIASECCTPCYTEAGWENTHSDWGHDEKSEEIVELIGEDEDGKRVKGCWICFPELNEASKSYVKRERTATAPTSRRAQLNHAGCFHDKTPAARRECRNAFWATGASSREAFGEYVASVWHKAGFVVRDGRWVRKASKKR